MNTPKSGHSTPIKSRLRICFAGGGSGGHINAGIAIAEALIADRSVDLLFLTSAREIDSKITSLFAGSLPASSVCHQIALPLRTSLPLPANTGRTWFSPSAVLQAGKWTVSLLNSFRIAVRALKRHQPEMIVGLGGFASLPTVAAASLLGIPVYLLEQNSVPGKANRICSRWAAEMWTGWTIDPAWSQTIRCPQKQTGIPLRQGFTCLQSRRKEKPAHTRTATRILITGGSLGARRLNELSLNALQQIKLPDHRVHVIHQTGNQWSAGDANTRISDSVDYLALPFLNNPAQEMADCDLVICRAGSMTLAEIAWIGIPAIIVPLGQSADLHQQANARAYQNEFEAVVIDEHSPEAAGQIVRLILAFAESGHLMDTGCPQSHSVGTNSDRTPFNNAAQRIASLIIAAAETAD
ncbi:MAG: UDP-N-acetylglucosamine--N-acetylmuramyl-(pentapeptide) pyrophosphoryl-undecaprenol N-acetylglucosamine transferase [Planctomycetaceae bacterium]